MQRGMTILFSSNESCRSQQYVIHIVAVNRQDIGILALQNQVLARQYTRFCVDHIVDGVRSTVGQCTGIIGPTMSFHGGLQNHEYQLQNKNHAIHRKYSQF